MGYGTQLDPDLGVIWDVEAPPAPAPTPTGQGNLDALRQRRRAAVEPGTEAHDAHLAALEAEQRMHAAELAFATARIAYLKAEERADELAQEAERQAAEEAARAAAAEPRAMAQAAAKRAAEAATEAQRLAEAADAADQRAAELARPVTPAA